MANSLEFGDLGYLDDNAEFVAINTRAASNITTTDVSAETHITDITGNPHNITIEQINGVPLPVYQNQVAAINAAHNAHVARTDNPHSVTRQQLGAGSAVLLDTTHDLIVNHIEARGVSHHWLGGGSVSTAGFSEANFTQAEKNALEDHLNKGGIPRHPLAGGTDATAGFSQADFTQEEKDKLEDIPADIADIVGELSSIVDSIGDAVDAIGDAVEGMPGPMSLEEAQSGTAAGQRTISADILRQTIQHHAPTGGGDPGGGGTLPPHIGLTGVSHHPLAGGTDATAGFSQANFTQAEKAKLENIPAGGGGDPGGGSVAFATQAQVNEGTQTDVALNPSHRASTTNRGTVQIATQAQVDAGQATDMVITPETLRNWETPAANMRHSFFQPLGPIIIPIAPGVTQPRATRFNRLVVLRGNLLFTNIDNFDITLSLSYGILRVPLGWRPLAQPTFGGPSYHLPLGTATMRIGGSR